MLEPGQDLVTLEETSLLPCYGLNFGHDRPALTDERVGALLVVGAWPTGHGDNWRLLVGARALDGVRWAVGCGRTGRREVPDARLAEYAGRSPVVRPDGGIRAELNVVERDLVVDLDPEVLARQRELVGVVDG